MKHLEAKHQGPISSGSNSLSSEFFPEIESTISQPNGHSSTTSPDVNISLSGALFFVQSILSSS